MYKRQLRGATEYASWTLTHGHRINHLTILHNALGLEAAVPTLAALNARMIADLGFEFNKAGGSDGLAQGSVASRLEQSSTVADHIEVTFGCGKEERLPCAFLELIQRCLLYTSPSPRDKRQSRMPSSA